MASWIRSVNDQRVWQISQVQSVDTAFFPAGTESGGTAGWYIVINGIGFYNEPVKGPFADQTTATNQLNTALGNLGGVI